MKTRDNASASKKTAVRIVVVGALALLVGALAWPLTASRNATSARPEVAGAISERDQPPFTSRASTPRAPQPFAAEPEDPMVVEDETPPDPAKPGAPVSAIGDDPGTDPAGQVIGRAWAQIATTDERIPEGMRFGGNKSFMLFPDPDPPASEPKPDDQVPEEGTETEPGRTL